MLKKKLKRILSMFMASAVTAASVCAGAAVLPHNAVPVQAAEMPALVRTYNMVRLDDVLGVKNSSNHNYNPKYDSTYGFLTSCSHGPSDGENYWSRYPASIYGYYDEVIGTWVQTTVKVWANEAYDLDDGHTCSEWPDKIMRYKAMPDGLSGCHITTRPCDNQLLRGASFVFSDPDNMTGTVTVYYAEECTIVSALNDSFVLSMGDKYQDVTIQNADGSAAQTIYTSRYSNVQFVSSSGYWMSSWADEDRTITYRNEVYDISPQRWELLDAGGGYVYIKREGGNGYLTVTGNSAGSVLRSERFNGSDYQKFRIVRSGTQITFHPENSVTDTIKIAKYGTGDASTGVTGLTNGTYEFQGWYTGRSGTGEKVYDASGLAVKGTYWSADGTSASWQSRADSLDLYAFWQPGKATQTLYFYRDGTKDDAKTKTYSASIGSTFDAESHKGDSTFEHCHFVKIDKSSWKVTGAASTNVYYETDKLSVSYNGNGAVSGSVSGTATPYGGTAAIAGNGFSRTGYMFTGWNTASDGSGTSYSEGQTFTAQPSAGGQTLTLYAQWKINSHSVKINKGTGISSTSGAGSYNYGSSVTVSAVPDTGYTWSGWTGTYESSARNHSFTMPDKDVVLNANAVPKTYTLTFNAEGGSLTGGGSCTVTFNGSACSDMSGTLPARTGYAFLGWYTAASGGVRVYDENGKYVQGSYWTADGKWIYDGSLNVYAHWILVSPPVVGASPSGTSVYSRNVDVTITAKAEDIVALAGSNSYQYCLSTGADAPSGNWTTYTNGMEFTMGNGLTGTYYLWVKHVKDSVGNESASSPNASYHRFGPYYFDNTAPDLSTVSTSYGWYASGTVIDFDIPDPHSGISSIVLTDFYGIVPEDGDITSDRKFYFGTEGVSFYTITASDRAGNTALKSFVVKIDKKGEVIPDNSVWKGLGDVTVFAHWMPNTYTVRFDKNDNAGGSPASGSMPDLKLTYDAAAPLTKNGFSRDGYTFTGWNTSPDGTGKSYTDGEPVKNLTVLPGEVITLYAAWEDTYIPVISVTPSRSVNPDVGNDAVKSIDVTITITEKGSGLSSSNKYEYGFSTSPTSSPDNWFEYCSSPASDSFSTTLNELGSSKTGYYYLWVKQIKDRYGNLSSSIEALATIASCHVYGVYAFDNSAPSGTVKYIENNATLGLYNDTLNASPYAVMSIYDAYDDVSGISGFSLVIADANNADNRAEFSFTENSGSYVCRFSLYDCLKNFQDVERVNMSIHSFDRLGNTATLPITSYDFGTLQSGSAIHADDIGFLLADSSGYVYSRDAFRVEAYIENISHNSHGTSFMGGQKGRLRIYTFGNVHSVCADFGSVKKYINPACDTHPDLEMTVIQPAHTAYIYLHDFFIPLGCASSTYTDTTAFGFKKGGVQQRNVIYDVSGTLTDNIKTILKYNAR